MKKIKPMLWIAFAIVVIAGILISRNTGNLKSYTEEEFLFDTRCSITVYGKNGKESVKKA